MRTLIAGYRPYELGIFKSSQEEAVVLREFLRNKILEYIDTGTEWFITQGYTGIDMYAAGEIIKLKEDNYDIKLAVMMPFHNFHDRYNEADLEELQMILKHSDFHDYLFRKPYDNPGMFRKINHFLLSNTDQAIVIYDAEADTKTRFIYSQMLEFSEDTPYNIERIQFDEINAFIDSRYDG